MTPSPDATSVGSIIATDLRTEYRVNPLGLDEPRPRLSWKVQSENPSSDERGLAQSAYQILVARDPGLLASGKGDLWESGRIESNASTFIEYAGLRLAAGERAWWSVRLWDQAGRPSKMSPAVFWETGPANWGGRWIGSNLVGSPRSEAQAPFLRCTFAPEKGKQIAAARLYATALGLYEFRINGQKVGDDVFTPGWTNYHKRVQYQAYDVTPMLRPGAENVLGAILGDGWYCGNTGNVRVRQYYGDRPKLLGQLHIAYTDGSSTTINTDSSWTTAAGPILSSDFFMGETYDARLEMPGWDAPGFVPDSRWTPALTFDSPPIAIVAMAGPTVKAIKELRPVSVKRKGTAFIVDLGQNMVGRVRLRVKGPRGRTVILQFAEILDKGGNLYTANLRGARQTDNYTLRGDPAEEVYESRFTFHGFRYVSVTDYPGELTADDFTGVVLHSEMKQIGTFECSDPLVNQLQQNIQWGQRGNFVDVPTDCPQRDERLGWTGDAQVFARTAAFNFDVAGFFAKWTQDLRDAQSQAGDFPSIVPNNYDATPSGPPSFTEDGGPAWADAGVICPWTMYLCYGDRRLLERHYDSMRRFVDRLEDQARPFGLIRSHPDWAGWSGFGDWLSQDGKDLFGATPKDLIGTAFLSHVAHLLSKIARVLGKSDDVAKYAQLADETAKAFCRRFVTEEGLIIGNTQTAYVLALQFDLLPEALRANAVKSLVRNIHANGGKLNTGFVGTPYLCDVLTRYGHLDLAYQLLVQKQWPSWLYAVTHGATTIWERWDGWTADRGFQDAGMNSFNHYAYGAVGDWLYRIVAGLDTDSEAPGYSHVTLKPHIQLGGPLTDAKATLDTSHGVIISGWRLDGQTLHYTASLPPNVTATLVLPAAVAEISESGRPLKDISGIDGLSSSSGQTTANLAAGTYEFVVKLKSGGEKG